MPETEPMLELSLENPTADPREGCPVTVGVPFPKGLLRSADTLELSDEDGQAIPLQARTLVSWPDGSAKWALLDCQVKTRPKEQKRLRIAVAERPDRPALAGPVRISRTRGAFDVRTDSLAFSVPSDRFSLLEGLSLNGNPVMPPGLGGDLVVVDGQGKEYRASAAKDLRVEVEEEGPLRSTIRISGKHASQGGKPFLDFVVRIHLYANRPYLRIQHQFINREEPEAGVDISHIAVRFPLSFGARAQKSVNHLQAGVPGRGWHGLPKIVSTTGRVEIRTSPTGWWTHLEEPSIAREEDGKRSLQARLTLPQGSVEPWVEVSDQNLRLVAAFWRMGEHFPKGLVADEGGLEFQIWPGWTGPLQLAQGMAKTHQLFLSFEDLGAVQESPPQSASALLVDLANPVHVVLPLKWCQECQVLGLEKVLDYQPARYPRVELFLKNLFVREWPRVWPRGMFDYGDDVEEHQTQVWELVGFGAGGPVWTNNEYDYLLVTALQYLRTGDAANLHEARIVARHAMDVDFVHYSPDPFRNGGVSFHSARHTTGLVEPSHQVAEGLLAYYCLSGDPEALEVANSIGDNLLRFVEQGMEIIATDARESGWPLIALCALYDATGEERFLEGARRIVQHQHSASKNGEYYPENATFAIAISLMGLKRYHQITGDAAAKNLFLAIADWWLKNRYVPEGVPAYVWALELRHPVAQENIPSGHHLFLEALAYAYEVTGDETFVDAGMRELEYHLDYGVIKFLNKSQKPVATVYRTLICFLKAADETGRLKALEYRY